MIRIPGKIPIQIHPLFWLLSFFIGWMATQTLTGTLLAVVVILVSVLFHEFGHALTAIAFGQQTRIQLAAFGGFTYREGRKLKLWEEFLVVLNGPVAGLILCVFAYLIYTYAGVQQGAAGFIFKFTYLANLFWTVINLVPVLPLDGGHLLSITLEGIFGFKGIKIALVVGLIFAIAISIFFFIVGAFLIGALFLLLTFESFRSLRYYKLLKEQDRDADLQTLLKKAEADFNEGRHDEALAKFQEVREKSREGILYTLATQEMAAILREKERYSEAYELLVPIRKSLSGDMLSLFQYVAFASGDYKTVADIGNKCFQDNPTYETALLNAMAMGSLSKSEAAVGWLECAIREGAPKIHDVLKREEFDPIRTDSRFQALTQKYS